MWENLPENSIIQLLIKNQEYLDNLVWNRKTVIDKTFKTTQKGPLKQGNNSETFRINCSNHLVVLSTTDDDDNDDNVSKSGKPDNTITEKFLTNHDVRNKKNYKKIILLTKNTKMAHLLKKKNTQIDHNRRQIIKAVSRTNKIIKDHHENDLNVNRLT